MSPLSTEKIFLKIKEDKNNTNSENNERNPAYSLFKML